MGSGRMGMVVSAGVAALLLTSCGQGTQARGLDEVPPTDAVATGAVASQAVATDPPEIAPDVPLVSDEATPSASSLPTLFTKKVSSAPTFSGANLRGAVLTEAVLDGANAAKTNFTKVRLDGAHGEQMDLQGADLTGASEASGWLGLWGDWEGAHYLDGHICSRHLSGCMRAD